MVSAAAFHQPDDLACLFAREGISLWQAAPPGAAGRIAQYQAQRPPSARKFILIVAAPFQEQADVQLAFSFPATFARQAGLVPRRSYDYLDHGVYDVFRDMQEAAGAARRLEAKGVFLLGQLVQMSETEIAMRRLADPRGLRAMASRLRKVGLHFGMDIPGWQANRNPARRRL